MEGIKFMEQILNQTDINVSIIGRINSFDIDQMTATVEPLMDDIPLLINVPVLHLKTQGFTIATDYKEGDIVVVLFLDSDKDNVLISGQKSQANSTRRHDISDGVIIGSIHTFNNAHFDLSSGALNIVGKNNHIKLYDNGDIDIKGRNIKIEGDRIDLN